MAPYRSQRNALTAIGGIALGAALAIALLLSRGATRPIGELVRAAQPYPDRHLRQGGRRTRRAMSSAVLLQPSTSCSRTSRSAKRASIQMHTTMPSPDCPIAPSRNEHLDELLHTAPTVPVALILLEVANLGEISASLGHHVGDEALRETARRLRQNCGENDITARLGSAQFLVVARGCSLAARDVAGRAAGRAHCAPASVCSRSAWICT